MNKIDNMTIGEAKELAALLSGKSSAYNPFEIGEAYLIRTVTHIDIGIVKAVGDKEIVLTNASWIADTGRFHDALKDGVKKLEEVEPYLDDVILGRGAIIDATLWRHSVPSEQK